ncbi:WhiB family transcriptional regulator [Pseudonocardia sp.]|uniref:WhiB family transcriptional regulator n=1 Tax=Pseudonocardia sp. TaxID=60912 RepID=UPI003D1284B6
MITEVAGRAWRLRAACAAPGTDPEVFFPIDTGPAGEQAVTRAKAVCAGCPVRVECLADVMGSEDPAERFGVCGGLSADERAALFARDRAPRVVALDIPVPVPVMAGVQLGLFDLTHGSTSRKGAA